MNNVLNTFYTGKINSFGFGTWNSNEPQLFQRTWANNTINRTKINKPTLTTQYLSTAENNNNYKPIPRTTMTNLNSTLTNNVHQSKVVALPYNGIPNTTIQGNMTTTNLPQKNFTPEIMKMQLLEEKIRQMEKANNEDKKNFRDILEGQLINNQNNLSQNNMNALKGLDPGIQSNSNGQLQDTRELRRKEIKWELEQARKKLANVSESSEGSDSKSSYGEESEEDTNSFGSPKFKKRKHDSIRTSTIASGLNQSPTPMELLNKPAMPLQGQRKSIFPGTASRERNSTISLKVGANEGEDFINSLPQHIALQWQSENFKVRENLSFIKTSFRDIQNDWQNKLDQMEMRQRLNLENLRFVVEKGGTNKLKAGIKKFIDKDNNIDWDEIEEEEPAYITELPGIIDEKIIQNDKRRLEEEKQRQEEEEKMRLEAMIELPPINGPENQNGYVVADSNDIIRPVPEVQPVVEVVEPANLKKKDKKKKGRDKSKKKGDKSKSKSKSKGKRGKDKKKKSKSKGKDEKKGKKSRSKSKGKKKRKDTDDEEPKKKKKPKSSRKRKFDDEDDEEEHQKKSKKRPKSTVHESPTKKSKSKSKKKNLPEPVYEPEPVPMVVSPPKPNPSPVRKKKYAKPKKIGI